MKLFIGISLFLCLQANAQRQTLMELPSEVRAEVDQVLSAQSALHRAFVDMNDDRIEIATRDLLTALDKAEQSTRFLKWHEQQHLFRILSSARSFLLKGQTTLGEERREAYREVFNQIANLVRIYQVNADYNIYFCDKEKIEWVQNRVTLKVGKNPLSQDRKPCAIKVNR